MCCRKDEVKETANHLDTRRDMTILPFHVYNSSKRMYVFGNAVESYSRRNLIVQGEVLDAFSALGQVLLSHLATQPRYGLLANH
jgi:hypothetical protein